MDLPTLAELEAAAALIRPDVPPTPQYVWPLLSNRAGCTVWVKHENHTPIGSFKVRGGLVYLNDLQRREPNCRGVIAATRGNHGQSVAFAARKFGVRAVIVAPHGNSIEKNAAMRALGAELVEQGHDFQSAYEHAQELASRDGLHMLPSFHRLLVQGVGTYGLELLRTASDLDTIYVPIGLGSGICGVLAAREALRAITHIVGVVSEQAPCYALSFSAGKIITTATANTLADGMACRVPDAAALDVIRRGVDRIVQVSDEEVSTAMRIYFTDAHQVAEGAGAAALAALLKEKDRMLGRKVALILSGGNVDLDLYRRALVI